MPFSADGFIASWEEVVVAAALLESSDSVALRIELGVVKAVDAVAVVVAAAASESVAGAGAGLVKLWVIDGWTVGAAVMSGVAVASGAFCTACGSGIGLLLMGSLLVQKINRGSQNVPILYGLAALVKLWKSLCHSCHLMEQLAQYCFVVAKAQASASLRNVASFASLFSATIWRDEIDRFWASLRLTG